MLISQTLNPIRRRTRRVKPGGRRNSAGRGQSVRAISQGNQSGQAVRASSQGKLGGCQKEARGSLAGREPSNVIGPEGQGAESLSRDRTARQRVRVICPVRLGEGVDLNLVPHPVIQWP